jgi:hypothetical protein
MTTKAISISVLAVALLYGPAAARSQETTPRNSTAPDIIFQQPILGGIHGNFHVPPAEHRYPTEQPFNLVLWQPNPNRSDGQLVPTNWLAGKMTGFYPSAPLAEHQAGFRDVAGASTAQIDGDTVGVYLNSADLTAGSHESKMMITPAVMLPKNKIVYPFSAAGSAILNSLELQVPVAISQNRPGNLAYVVINLLFEDRQSKTKISYAVDLFHHSLRAAPPPPPERLQQTELGKFDPNTQSFQVGNPLAYGSRVVTVVPGSTLFQTTPWKGWRLFQAEINERDFSNALHALEGETAFHGSGSPADYRLIEWHLNAELMFGSGPAELGWSMRHAKVTMVQSGL